MRKLKCIHLACLLALSVLCLLGCSKGNAGKAEKVEISTAVAKEDIEEARTKAEKEAEKEADEEAGAKTKESQTANGTVSNGIIVALDPGHQGWDVDMSATEPNAPGSSEMKRKATAGTSGAYTGIPEYQLNLDIALMVRDELVKQGYQVIMTREDNQTAISNAERATLANEAGADISVRIHANGSEDSSVSGALALIPSAQNAHVGYLYDPSYALADKVLNAYCNATGIPNQGVRTNDTMTGINWSQIPVMILEMGYMSNQSDDQLMADPEFRKQMVAGIVEGINQYYLY